MQWLMLQQDEPDDFVIATGQQYSVGEFITWAAQEMGIAIRFSGEGIDEIAMVDSVDNAIAPAVKPGDVIMRVDPRYFRPSEVAALRGDSGKAKSKLGWEPEISARQMCAEMVAADLETARQHWVLQNHGFLQRTPLEHYH